MPKQDPDWKLFEKVNAEIQRQMAPGATVTHNARIRDKHGKLRQVDVLIEQQIGMTNIRIIVECRKRSRPVDNDAMGGFVQKVKDLPSHQGIMVSAKGFDGGAKSIGMDNRILMLDYREACEADWTALLGEDSWFQIVTERDEIGDWHVQFDSPLNGAVADENTMVHDTNGVAVGTILEMVGKAVNGMRDLPVRTPVGKSVMEARYAEPHGVILDGTRYDIKVICINVEMFPTLYNINLKFAGGLVLDEASSSDRQFAALFTEGFDWKEFFETQPVRVLTPEEYEDFTSLADMLIPGSKLAKMQKFIRMSCIWKR